MATTPAIATATRTSFTTEPPVDYTHTGVKWHPRLPSAVPLYAWTGCRSTLRRQLVITCRQQLRSMSRTHRGLPAGFGEAPPVRDLCCADTARRAVDLSSSQIRWQHRGPRRL